MAEFSAAIIAHQKKRKSLAALVINELLNDGKNTRKPRGKTRAWIRRRSEKGSFNNIVQELMIEDTAGYKEMTRMNYGDSCLPITRQELLGGAKVVKAPERLALAIRFMATGDTFRSLSFQFRISIVAISYMIREVCQALKEHFMPNHVSIPSSTEEWLEVAKKFEEKWNYPHCLGAIDGKHVVMQCPAKAVYLLVLWHIHVSLRWNVLPMALLLICTHSTHFNFKYNVTDTLFSDHS